MAFCGKPVKMEIIPPGTVLTSRLLSEPPDWLRLVRERPNKIGIVIREPQFAMLDLRNSIREIDVPQGCEG